MSEMNSYIMIAGNAEKLYIDKLRGLGFEVIKTIKADFLYDAIAYHPDIVVHMLDKDNVFIEKSLVEIYGNLLKDTRLNIMETQKCFSKGYPNYTGLNIGRVGNYYIQNENYIDSEIASEFNIRGMKLLGVKQGYAKCSTLTIKENAIITSDRGIEKALKSIQGMDVLYINPEGINLKGMSYGFIGGCGGMISDNDIVLTGRYDHLADKEEIDEFFKKYKINVIYLSDKGINDIGGIIKLR